MSEVVYKSSPKKKSEHRYIVEIFNYGWYVPRTDKRGFRTLFWAKRYAIFWQEEMGYAARVIDRKA